MMDPDSQLRNLRDFLLVYNRMTEICFQRCSSNFNYRNLTMDESRCVDSCAGKLIRSNHRLMATYSQLMPRMVQRRMEEMESKAAEIAAAGPPVTEASPASETPIATAPSPLLAASATDVGPEAPGSVPQPAGLDIPLELDATVSKSTMASAVQSSANMPLTPATDTVNLSVVEMADSAASFKAAPPLPPIGGAQIESVPVFVPAKPMSLTDDTSVSTAAAVSTATVSLSERAPDVPPQSDQ